MSIFNQDCVSEACPMFRIDTYEYLKIRKMDYLNGYSYLPYQSVPIKTALGGVRPCAGPTYSGSSYLPGRYQYQRIRTKVVVP